MSLEEKIVQLEKEVSDERGRLSSDRMDISFGEIINLYTSDELVIRPEYQRLYRWSPEQKTALIESILLSIPIPPIFVAEDKDGIWELVDGLQRVATIISFFGELKSDISAIQYNVINDVGDIEDEKAILANKWLLSEGGLIPSLDGFNVDNIPTRLKINIKRAACRVEILRGGSSSTMKYELFKRLNSGGSKLNPQEIRNAIYRGLGTKINDLLIRLCDNDKFKALTQLSEQKKLELYDQELALRFVAFYKNIENINDNTENFLNKFMEKASGDDTFDVEAVEKMFYKSIELVNSIDDIKVFRNDRNTFVPAYFEGIMLGLAHNYELYISNKELLITNIEKLKDDEDFKRFSGSSSSSKSRNKNRLSRAVIIFNV